MAAVQNAGLALDWARRTLGVGWPELFVAMPSGALPADAPVFLGEPEDRSGFDNMRDGEHPGAMPGDTFVGDRPAIRFNPVNGRPAFPLLRPHFNARAPFSPQGHSGAPWLGERGDAAKSKDGPDPAAGRPDGICPSGSQARRFNLVSIELPIRVTQKGATDPNGKVFVLAKDADDVLAGRKAPEPLAIRGEPRVRDAL